MTSPAVTYARQNNPRFLSELKDLLRIPSVSTLPENKADCRRTAESLAAELTRIGMEHAHLIETDSHPLVYADWLHAAGKPTVLCYGHYDVQPPDPLDEWITPPFEPTERDGNLYGRGTADDKGQVWIQVKALESLMAANGKLPMNVRVILEGDEEVGGEGIAAFVASKPPELKADFSLVSDTEMFAPGLPTLCVGLRGMIYAEIEVHGSMVDLHSGSYGGVAPNPFMALAEILTGLKDKNGHILIPGFYDDIIPPSPEELKAWKSLPFDEEHYRKTEIGSPALVGEPGYSVMERTWGRPTFEVHGMPGGFTGAGAKTVIPAKALAKVSMRLVPGMTAAKAYEQFKSYVEKIAPAGVTVQVRSLSGGEPSLIRVDDPYIQAATRALHEVWGKDTVFIRCGGSVPIVGDFERHLGAPGVMMGFGLPDDNIHAPNEKFCLKNFELGIESIIRFLEEAGK
jgi:acetylornithine deacetylase/succinyl-diaminopimelate desuccinylase-like protein